MKTTFLLSAILFLLSLFNAKAQSVEKLYANKDYSQLIQEVDSKGERANANDYLMAAQSAVALYSYSQAVHFYEKVLYESPANEIALEGYTDALLALGKKQEALQALESLETINKEARIQAKKAALLMDLNHYRQAELLYNDLYSSDSTNLYFLRRLALSRYKQKVYHKVLELKINNSHYDASDKELEFMVADSFYRLNNNQEAIPVLKNIIQNDSLYRPAISKLAYIYFANYRNYEDAVIYYRTLNELEDYEDATHLKNLAICEFFTGDHAFAAYTLDSLITELSGDAFVPFYAGLSYQKMGGTDDALRCLEIAAGAAIPAYTADIYHHLGRTYILKREFEKGLATYKKVREYDPSNYQVLYDIAVTHEEHKLSRAVAYEYYKQFVKECDNQRNSNLKYAQDRMSKIEEEMFFESE